MSLYFHLAPSMEDPEQEGQDLVVGSQEDLTDLPGGEEDSVATEAADKLLQQVGVDLADAAVAPNAYVIPVGLVDAVRAAFVGAGWEVGVYSGN